MESNVGCVNLIMIMSVLKDGGLGLLHGSAVLKCPALCQQAVCVYWRVLKAADTALGETEMNPEMSRNQI